MVPSPEAVREKLIVALDTPGAVSALELDRRLGDEVKWVKVGLELFTAAGPAVVEALRERGRSVFLDLKLHDIPNTVAGAVRAAADHGVSLLTVHAEGGPAMMRAARRAADESGSELNLLAVTVLTSLDGTEYPEVYRSSNVAARVLELLKGAWEAGMDGVVCSPLELQAVRRETPEAFLRVAPGIRPTGASAGDQSRVATPAAALQAGATHIVVGRAISKSPEPAASARAILQEMAGV